MKYFGATTPPFRISDELLELARADAWSIECMEAHGAAGRQVDYIGSRIEKNIIYDYYRDTAGKFWYGKRAVVNGQVVSMEEYIFGHKVIRKSRAYKRKRH